MNVPRIGSEAGEPSVRHPLLQEIVAEARARPLPALRVDADRVREQWLAQRRSRRWTLLASAAAVVLAVGAVRLGTSLIEAGSPESPTPQLAAQVVEPAPIESSIEPPLQPVTKQATPAPEPAIEVVRLAEGVVIDPVGDHVDVPVIVSTWEVQVAAGQYHVEVPVEAVSTLRLVLEHHRLEIEPGTALDVIAGDPPQVLVSRGRARLIDVHGTARDFGPPSTETASTATELARRAEAQMARGDTRGAMRTLEQLVKRHPRTSPAKSGLLDLARLRKVSGDEARARCAYELYLERWPSSPLRADVERAVQGLSSRRGCRGLTPTKR